MRIPSSLCFLCALIDPFRFRSKRVSANRVYNEVIADRHHTHLNSTRWQGLGSYCRYLGESGKAKVEQTDEGWFLTYINRDPLALQQEAERDFQERGQADSETRNRKMLETRIAALKALEQTSQNDETQASEAHSAPQTAPQDVPQSEPREQSGPIKFALAMPGAPKAAITKPLSLFAGDDAPAVVESKRKLTEVELIQMENEAKRERRNRRDYWLQKGIWVKIIRADSDHLLNRKVQVNNLIDKYTAELLIDGASYQFHQRQLQTVLPARGGVVLVVNGAYRGSAAKLVDIDIPSCSATIEIADGLLTGRVVNGIEYEDITKFE